MATRFEADSDHDVTILGGNAESSSRTGNATHPLAPYAESAPMFVKTYALGEFAIASIVASSRFFKKSCYGCEVNHPSQRQHSCLMEDTTELYGIYIDDILKEVNHQAVRQNVERDIQMYLQVWRRDYIAEFFDGLPKPGDDEWNVWTSEIAACMESLGYTDTSSRIERYYEEEKEKGEDLVEKDEGYNNVLSIVEI